MIHQNLAVTELANCFCTKNNPRLNATVDLKAVYLIWLRQMTTIIRLSARNVTRAIGSGFEDSRKDYIDDHWDSRHSRCGLSHSGFVEEAVIWHEQEPVLIMGVWARVYKAKNLRVFVTQDPPAARWHLSISHPHRYPTYEEIKAARYHCVPNEVYMAMIFPPKEEFVNLHQNCFHLHEFRDKEIIK